MLELAGSDHQVHVRGPLEDSLLLFLGHATQHADDRLRLPLLGLLQPAQGAVDLVLGMLPHAAGVEENGVGLRGGVDQLIAGPQQAGGDQLAVEHVHLAADRFDVKASSHSESTSQPLIAATSTGATLGRGRTLR